MYTQTIYSPADAQPLCQHAFRFLLCASQLSSPHAFICADLVHSYYRRPPFWIRIALLFPSSLRVQARYRWTGPRSACFRVQEGSE